MSPLSSDHAALAERCLTAATRVRLLVVGDLMLDRYVSGSVDRISPEAPVPVVHERRRRAAPGGAANVAAGIRALGAAVRLVGAVGADRAGSALIAALERRGIPTGDIVRVSGRPTTTKVRILARHQQVLRIDREDSSPFDAGVARELAARAVDRLEEADAVVLQDYDKGVLSPAVAEPVIVAARGAGTPVVVDPKLRRFFGYRGATVFKPNRAEAAKALGVEDLPMDGPTLRALADRLECDHLVITLGAGGMCLLEHGSTVPTFVPSRAREVYDVSGAGDTVTAVLATALACGIGTGPAARLANLAAGIAVARLGARPVGRRSLLAAARTRPGGVQQDPQRKERE